MPTSVIKSWVLTFRALLLIVRGEGTKMLCLLRIWWPSGPEQGLAAWQTLHWCLLFICATGQRKGSLWAELRSFLSQRLMPSSSACHAFRPASWIVNPSWSNIWMSLRRESADKVIHERNRWWKCILVTPCLQNYLWEVRMFCIFNSCSSSKMLLL